MFKFEELTDIHLEITSNCQASCPMCPRNYRGGIPNPNLDISSWTLNDFTKIFNEELLFQIRGFYFCGNFGDPILNDDLIEMIDHAVKINPNVAVRVHTNGGARKEEWWRRLAKVMPKNHDIHFAIDGLEDTHHLYRIGTTYNVVLRNAKAFIEEGGNAVWAFIKFKHNEHQAEEAERRAKEFGFSRFVLKTSNRFVGEPKFAVYDKDGNTTHYLEPASDAQNKFIDKEFIPKIKEYLEDTKITCIALDKKEIYIDAWKKVFPCCFLGLSGVHRPPENVDITQTRNFVVRQYVDYTNRLSQNDGNDASAKSIKDILNGNEWQSINWHKEYWTGENKMIICARTCGKSEKIALSKPADQFVKTVKLEDMTKLTGDAAINNTYGIKSIDDNY